MSLKIKGINEIIRSSVSSEDAQKFKDRFQNLFELISIDDIHKVSEEIGIPETTLAQAKEQAKELLSNPEIFSAERDRANFSKLLCDMDVPMMLVEEIKKEEIDSFLDVQRHGLDFSKFENITPDLSNKLASHSRLAVISSDLDINNKFINAGIKGVIDLARKNENDLAETIAEEPSRIRSLLDRARVYRAQMRAKLAEAAIAHAPVNKSYGLYQAKDIPPPPVLPAAEPGACHICEAHKSALSPGAYLVDLTGFMMDSFPAKFPDILYFDLRLYRKFELLLSYEAVEKKVRQIEIANEVLEEFIFSKSEGLTRDQLYASFRIGTGYPKSDIVTKVFDAYLDELGTMRKEIEEAFVTASSSPPDRKKLDELIDRLGLTEEELKTLDIRDPVQITIKDVDVLQRMNEEDPGFIQKSKTKGIDTNDPMQLAAHLEACTQAELAIDRVKEYTLADIRSNLIYAALKVSEGGQYTNAGEYDIFLVKFNGGDRNHIWSRCFGGKNPLIDDAYSNAVAIDSNGDLIIAGYFSGTLDFGGGPLMCKGSTDIFIGKFKGADGSHVWSHNFGYFLGLNSAYGYSVAVDNKGDLVVTGYFSGTLNFGTGPLTSTGRNDLFIAKFDGSKGKCIWSRRFGGTDSNLDSLKGYSVAIDTNSDLLVTGYFSGTVDFEGKKITSVGGSDIFVAKFKGADGGYIWSCSFPGTWEDIGKGLTVDRDGNVLVTGYFSGEVDFGGGPLTSTGRYDIFIVKFNGADGSHIWSRSFGGKGGKWDSAHGYSVAADGSGDLIVTGYFKGTLDFGGGQLISKGSNDVFVAKFKGMDGSHVWAHGFGGKSSSSAHGYAVAADSYDDLVVTGYFSGTLDFGGGQLISSCKKDIFAAKLNGVDGSHIWSCNSAGTWENLSRDVCTNGDGNVMITGFFSGTLDLNPTLSALGFSRTPSSTAEQSFQNAKELGNYLHIDLSVGACAMTTRTANAIEALQDFIMAFQMGREKDVQLALQRDEFEARWRWMQSYGLWHAAIMVFLYPENFMFHNVRRNRTEAFLKLVGELEAKANPESVRKIVNEYVSGVPWDISVGKACEFDGKLILFGRNIKRELGKSWSEVYYSTLDSYGDWSGWKKVPFNDEELAEDINLEGVVSVYQRILFFFSIIDIKDETPKTYKFTLKAYSWIVGEANTVPESLKYEITYPADDEDSYRPLITLIPPGKDTAGYNPACIYIKEYAGKESANLLLFVRDEFLGYNKVYLFYNGKQFKVKPNSHIQGIGVIT